MKTFFRILLTGLLCFANTAHSQTYFNNRYDSHNRSEVSNNIIEVDSGFIHVASPIDTVTGKWNILIRKINQVGVTLWEKEYSNPHFSYPLTSGSLIRTSDNNFVVSGSEIDSTNVYDVLLFKFDTYGDSIWLKTIENHPSSFGYDIRETSDGGFIITSYTSQSGNSDILIIKTDNLGNEEWTESYDNGGLNDFPSSIEITSDNGFIIGASSGSPADAYVIKTDSVGNIEWDQTYGVTEHDNGGIVIPTQNGGYIMASGQKKYEIDGYDQIKVHIYKLDITGGVEWENEVGHTRHLNGAYAILEKENGDYILGGNMLDTNGSSTGTGFNEAWIMRINSTGDSISYFVHENCSTDVLADNYLEDFDLTSDGGVIGCGYIFPGSSCGGNQDMWVIKLDSLGNSTGFIETNTQEIRSLKIYPNPSSGQFTIEMDESNSSSTAHIYNQFGIHVRSISLMEKNTVISDLSSGFFLIQITDGSSVTQTQKVVIN